MSEPIKRTYKFLLSDEQVKAVRDPYYRKESLKELVDLSVNPMARELLIENYTEAYSDWKANLDKIEHDVLKDMYQNFQYEFVITFGDNTMTLQAQFETEEETKTIQSYLINKCDFMTESRARMIDRINRKNAEGAGE